MKKLVYVFALAVMAFGVQAASMDWSTGVFEGPDGSSSKTGSKYSGVYSAVLTVYADAEGSDVLGTSAAVDSVSKKGAISGTVDITEPASGVTKTFYTQLVITDVASGKTLSNEMASFTWTGGDLTAPALIFYGDDASGFVGGSVPTISGGGWAGSDTPEPTSGLLLLVGGAMLALRRKQK